MKNIFSILTIALVFLMTSCSTYNHSYRVSNVPEQEVKLSDKVGVELKIDLNRVIRATSNKQTSIKDAKDEAYYKAIVDNQIHVLVDPIYSVETSAKFLMFGGKSRASVIGFAGSYTNPKPLKQSEAENKAAKAAKEQAAYERTVKEMDLLAKNNIIGSRSTENSSLACFESCGSGDKAINAMEVTRTATKTSLVDEYIAFKKSMDAASDGSNSDDNSSTSILGAGGDSLGSIDALKKGIVGKVLGKVKSLLKKKKK